MTRIRQNPYYELEQDALADIDIWFSEDEDRVDECWVTCPSHIRSEAIEDYEGRNYEEEVVNGIAEVS